MQFSQLLEHTGTEYISEDLRDYAVHQVLPQYLIYRRDHSTVRAVCTACDDTCAGIMPGVYHNTDVYCMQCGTKLTAKSAGIVGRGGLCDRAYILRFDKSRIDSDAIVARGVYVRRSVTVEKHKPLPDQTANWQIKYELEDLYLFRHGLPTEYYHNDWYRPSYWGIPPAGWCRRTSIRDRSTGQLRFTPHYVDFESLMAAIQGTVWERYPMAKCIAGLQQHNGLILPLLDLMAKYPCVEYLLKMEMWEPIYAKINRWKTYGAINWRGKTASKVLRCSMQDVRMLQKAAPQGKVTPLLLNWLKEDRKHGGNLSVDLLDSMIGKCGWRDTAAETAKHKIVRQYGWNKAVGYIARQKGHSTLRELSDYWGECEILGMDLSKDAIRWPKDLDRAHALTAKAVRIKLDSRQNAMIAQRYSRIEGQYTMARGGLTMHPARSSAELTREGQELHHCVATYAKRHALGEVTICFIRRTDAPDTPYYTVEFNRRGKVVQCRGLRNCAMTEEVAAFVEWAEKKIAKEIAA